VKKSDETITAQKRRKKNTNTAAADKEKKMKTVIEMEMPGSCAACSLMYREHRSAEGNFLCLATGKIFYALRMFDRDDSCPLKIEAEKLNQDYFSMNCNVYFKLTEKGKEIWDNENAKLNKEFLHHSWEIEYHHEDWVKDQLWCVFNRFGQFCSNGMDLCIYDITFYDPAKNNKGEGL
jgi:hypothetical protein